MNLLKNISVGKKIGLLIVTAIIGLVAMFTVANMKMGEVYESASYCTVNSLPSVKVLDTGYLALDATRINLYDHILNTDENKMHEIEAEIQKERADVEEALVKYEKLLSDDKDKAMLEADHESVNAYFKKYDEVLALSRANKNTEARDMVEHELDALAHTVDKNLEKHLEYNYHLADEATVVAEEDKSEAFIDQLGIAFVVGLVLMVLGFGVLKIVTGSLEKVKEGLVSFFSFLSRESANAKPIVLESEDEFGQMAKEINDNIKKIEKQIVQDNEVIDDAKVVIARVNNGWYSQNIEKSTSNPSLEEFKNGVNGMIQQTRARFIEVDEILESYAKLDYTPTLKMKPTDEHGGVFERLVKGVNELQNTVTVMLGTSLKNGYTLQNNASTLSTQIRNLSQSANEQASSLEETAAAIEEMTSNVTANADKANVMSRLSIETKRAAEQGMELTNRTFKVMDEIATSTNAINEAVAIIDQIAFQTNILSLNAAVEAATAGDAGKGFAVVAQEVRNLANRSADAAKQIQALASSAASKTGEGKKASEDMISGFKELNAKIDQTTQLVDDVANATKEQMQGISQINTAVTQLDSMTQENARIASETSGVANDVSIMASDLVADANSKKFNGKDSAGAITPVAIKASKPVQAPKPVIETPKVVAQTAPARVSLPASANDDEKWDSF